MSNATKYTTSFVTLFKDAQEAYDKALQDIRQCDQEISDWMHEAELGDDKDMYQGYLVYKGIREARRRRRIAKNESELLRDLCDYLNSQHAQGFKNKIKQIQGGISKTEHEQRHRVYVPRQLTEMSTMSNSAPAPKQSFESMMNEFKKTKITKSKGKYRK